MIYYSASTGGFYDTNIITDIPQDGVEVAMEDYVLLMSGQSARKDIVADSHGYPVLSDQQPPTAAQLLVDAIAETNSRLSYAAIKIAPLQDADDLGESTAEETSRLKVWKKYRIALMRVNQQAAYPNKIEWPVIPE